MPYDLRHNDQLLGSIASMDDVRRIRDGMRGTEFIYGTLSNALDYVLSGSDSHLAYLSPRDRRAAESVADEIRNAIR
jgi:hypothetical protein